MGKFITAKGFTTALGSLDNLPIADVLYAYNEENSEIIILKAKKSIYLCDKMDELLIKPIQSEEVGVHVDTHTKRYYPDDTPAQLLPSPYGTKMTVFYDGVLL